VGGGRAQLGEQNSYYVIAFNTINGVPCLNCMFYTNFTSTSPEASDSKWKYFYEKQRNVYNCIILDNNLKKNESDQMHHIANINYTVLCQTL